MKRKIISMLMAAVIALTTVDVSVFAAEKVVSGAEAENIVEEVQTLPEEENEGIDKVAVSEEMELMETTESDANPEAKQEIEVMQEIEAKQEIDSEQQEDDEGLSQIDEDEITLQESVMPITSAGNTFDTATTLMTNVTYSDNLVNDSALNYYKFITSKDGGISITFKNSYTEVNQRYWRIRLYNEEKKEIDYWEYRGGTEKVNTTQWIGLPASTYYIKVDDPEFPFYFSSADYFFTINHDSSTLWEIESNDSFETANNLSLNNEISGSVMVKGDEDYYKVTTNEDGYISIFFSRSNTEKQCGWRIRLYNEEKQELKNWLYHGMKGGEYTSMNLGLPASTYYLMVTDNGAHSDKTYGLKVNYETSNSWETEINDTFETADKVKLNSEISGGLMKAEDQDYYKVTTDEDGYMSFSFSHDDMDSTSWYWKLTLYDEEKNEITRWGYKGGKEVEITTAKIGLPASTYYLLVEKNTSHTDTNYSLKVNYEASNLWETEVNNSFETADSIHTNKEILGSLMVSEDIDYYKVAASADGYLSLSFEHEYVDNNAAHYEVRLYNAAREEMMCWWLAGNIAITDTKEIGLPAGNYYVKVQKGSKNHTSGDYNLKVNYTPSSAWETEFNNELGKADEITAGETIKGNLMSSSDVDYYRLNVPTGNNYIFTFIHDYIENKKNFWNVTIYNEYMEEIKNYKYAGNVIRVKEEKQYFEAGNYYIKVVKDSYSDVNYSFSMGNGTVDKGELGNFHKSKVEGVNVMNDLGGIIVTWKQLSDADGYFIYRKKGSGKWQQIGQVTGADNLQYIDVNVESGATYTYKVTGYAVGIVCKDSANKKIKYLSDTTVNAENAAKGVKVTWKKVKGAAGYYIYRSLKGQEGKKIATVKGGNKVSYTDTKTASGTVYEYSVRAYAGKTQGSLLDTNVEICYAAQPKLMKVQNVANGISLTWKESNNASSYRVYRKEGSGDWREIAAASGTDYVDTTVVDGIKYSYKVKAEISYKNSSGFSVSDYSKESAAKTLKHMAEPKNVQAKRLEKGVEVTWDTTYGAKGYYIYRRLEDGAWKKVGTVKKGTKDSFVDKKAKNDKVYYYAVAAYAGNVKSSKNEYGVRVY